MKPPDKYKVIGLMSGTSLDGLDIAYCEYSLNNASWLFEILECTTVKYDSNWMKKLSSAHALSGQSLVQLDFDFGMLLGKHCNSFIKERKIKKVGFIASHGHTIFHQPQAGFTYQLGNGIAIYSITKIPVVFDFRTLDVVRGGQGAPLVPVGDHLLFSNYDACINLGGIANISFKAKQERIAFDICFVNMALNYLADKVQKRFDKGGRIAASGKVNRQLLGRLDAVYSKWKRSRPSLGREGFEKYLEPILNNNEVSVPDCLRTVCESICQEIVQSLPQKKKAKVLVTGGGAYNTFLIARLSEMVSEGQEVVVPDKSIVEFKEAMVFGFLGVRKVRGEVNVLKSVTGASNNSIAGTTVGF
ncbi:MAG: anhydro-N-acetylmuramic acid kinase [Cyclobacteriaceae bacterium]